MPFRVKHALSVAHAARPAEASMVQVSRSRLERDSGRGSHQCIQSASASLEPGGSPTCMRSSICAAPTPGSWPFVSRRPSWRPARPRPGACPRRACSRSSLTSWPATRSIWSRSCCRTTCMRRRRWPRSRRARPSPCRSRWRPPSPTRGRWSMPPSVTVASSRCSRTSCSTRRCRRRRRCWMKGRSASR